MDREYEEAWFTLQNHQPQPVVQGLPVPLRAKVIANQPVVIDNGSGMIKVWRSMAWTVMDCHGLPWIAMDPKMG